MPTVEMTRHLYRFFPALENRTIELPAGSVAQILSGLEAMAPGIGNYLLDERGTLRRHVNLCINERLIIDRKTLSEHVPEGARLYIFQALSGG